MWKGDKRKRFFWPGHRKDGVATLGREACGWLQVDKRKVRSEGL